MTFLSFSPSLQSTPSLETSARLVLLAAMQGHALHAGIDLSPVKRPRDNSSDLSEDLISEAQAEVKRLKRQVSESRKVMMESVSVGKNEEAEIKRHNQVLEDAVQDMGTISLILVEDIAAQLENLSADYKLKLAALVEQHNATISTIEKLENATQTFTLDLTAKFEKCFGETEGQPEYQRLVVEVKDLIFKKILGQSNSSSDESDSYANKYWFMGYGAIAGHFYSWLNERTGGRLIAKWGLKQSAFQKVLLTLLSSMIFLVSVSDFTVQDALVG